MLILYLVSLFFNQSEIVEPWSLTNFGVNHSPSRLWFLWLYSYCLGRAETLKYLDTQFAQGLYRNKYCKQICRLLWVYRHHKNQSMLDEKIRQEWRILTAHKRQRPIWITIEIIKTDPADPDILPDIELSWFWSSSGVFGVFDKIYCLFYWSKSLSFPAKVACFHYGQPSPVEFYSTRQLRSAWH